MPERIIRGPILNPEAAGRVAFWPDGVLLAGADGRLRFAGHWKDLEPRLGSSEVPVTRATGIITPPFLDCHTHIPQFPIRGHFTDGLPDHLREGRLLAGLERNVFPQEARCADEEYAEAVVQGFAQAALSQGVAGGAAYMTVHAAAARTALRQMPAAWSVGLVLMNQHCPAFLRTDEANLERDVECLTEAYGRRLIVTDRFAVSVDTPLRRRAVALAGRLGLRMQTHLNEQRAEKALVEDVLYPGYGGYTDVYRQDGLLDRTPILAHCIQMRPEEWNMLGDKGATVAHCPTSNTLLGSGTMPLDEVRARGLPYALCTDMGASPTTSLLAEMAQFLKVHAGRSDWATPSESLFRATLAPAQILGLDGDIGSFEAGKMLSCVEVEADVTGLASETADAVIRERLLGAPSVAGLESDLDQLATQGLDHGDALARLTQDVHAAARRLDDKVLSVTLGGETVWRRKRGTA